jgi:hypothetical protein
VTVEVPYFEFDGCLDAVHRVRLGKKITKIVVKMFKFGQCHALALALNEILGWPIYGCYHQFSDSRETVHYMVECPKWGFADIHGIRCLDYGYRKVNPDTIRKGRQRNHLKPHMVLARHYAPMIAAEIMKQYEAIAAGKEKPKWTICSEGYSD